VTRRKLHNPELLSVIIRSELEDGAESVVEPGLHPTVVTGAGGRV